MSSTLLSAHDPHSATITLRFIRSFEYRTVKLFVLRNIDLTTSTPRTLLDQARKIAATEGGFRPYRTVVFNSAKIYSQAHLTKTQNLAINLDHEDWILTNPEKLDSSLYSLGVLNEAEISIYNEDAYLQFAANPVQKWDNDTTS